MTDRRKGIQVALDYIESHLTEELEISRIAREACLSDFHFQRIFGALCGMGVGEYIRSRRLSLAGETLANTPIRVIDAAARYGYDSPDSFSRAFQRFHGIAPSAARKAGAALRYFPPVKIHYPKEDTIMLAYKIVEKPQFTLMGLARKFSPDTSYQEIPKFWEEVFSAGNCPLMGIYGVCLDEDVSDGCFTYLIADNYCPCQEIPEGMTVKVIPASTWAVFPCKLGTLQDTNTRMWSEWLPNCREYKLARNLNLEVYGTPAEKPEDSYCELWLPVERI